MHHALRSSLTIVASAVCIAACIGCQTHDRRIYTTHRDKNLHTPNPWAPSTTKAADDATAAMGITPQPTDSANPVTPGAPATPPQ